MILKFINKESSKHLRALLVFVIILSWVFSGLPQIFNFPPRTEKAQAAPIAQYSGGLLVYADGTAGTPKYKTFDDTSGFGAEQSAQSVGASAIEWIRVAASPTADEWIIVTRDVGDVIKAQVCTGVDGGVSCGSPTTITSTAGTHGFRNFDIVYEGSGDALLVYGTATADELRKIVWTGGAWGSDAAITTTRTSGTVEWVELTARAATSTWSDQIGIAYSDTNDDVSAYRWDGTSAADEATAVITAAASVGNSRKLDVSFEGASGDMLVASALESAGTTATGALSGTTWTIASQTGPDNDGNYIDLQDPGPDNDIAIITYGNLTTSNPSEGYEWSGTGITDGTAAVDTSTLNYVASYQSVSTAFVSTTYYAAAVFPDATGADDINWWTMNNAGTWTAQSDNLRTRGTIRFQKLFDYPNLDKVLLLSSDANSDLWADAWDGSAPSSTVWVDRSGGATLEGSLSSATTEVYDFSFRLAPLPPSFDQSAYRIFDNNDGTQVGNTALGSQDATTTVTGAGKQFRLRMLLHVSQSQASSETFKLQFATSTGGACIGLSYEDVTTATAISFYDNTTPADGAAMTASSTDPTHSGDTIVGQTYEEANNFSVSTAIPSGQDGKWDFSLYNNVATDGSTYCFQAVYSSGSAIEAYSKYPAVVIDTPPVIRQLHYRFRDDSGDESSATYLAAEDTSPTTIYQGDIKRLRFLVWNDGGSPVGGSESGSVTFCTSGCDFGTGTTTWQVPSGVTSITVKAWGAGGGGASGDATGEVGGAGGGGGAASSTIAVTALENLTVAVGGGGAAVGSPAGGAGGGGGGYGGGKGAGRDGAESTNGRAGGSGGGYSAVLRSSTYLIQAGGGGGGGGGGNSSCTGGAGGAGGGTSGVAGSLGTNNTGTGGGGGTTSAGGAVGTSMTSQNGGSSGVADHGGDGKRYPSADTSGGGGGGGGGRFGGGGGGAGGGGNECGNGGGGGSSLATNTLAGSGTTAGGAGDSDYAGNAGQGGAGAGSGNPGVAGNSGRVVISWTGGGSFAGYKFGLEHSSSSCTSWFPVRQGTGSVTGGVHWRTAPVVGYSDNASSTNFTGSLADPGGGATFLAGSLLGVSNTSSPVTLNANQFTELEYTIQSTSFATANTTYCFRVTDNGSITDFVYNVIPSFVLKAINTGGGGASENSGSGGNQTGGGSGGGGAGEGSGSGGSQGGGGAGGGGGVE